MLAAFHEQSTVRDLALARLERHVADGQLVGGTMSWDGTTGSLVGCLTESAEVDDWERQLGLPGWLAFALEAASAAVEPAVVLGMTRSALNAVGIGTDLSLHGSVVVRTFLSEAVKSPQAEPIDPMLTKALDQMYGLHTRASQGVDIEPSEWRLARKIAVAATEAQRSPASQAVARCVESAGWNPLNSQTAVADVIRAWVKVQSLNDVPYDWTEPHRLSRRPIGLSQTGVV